MEIERVIVEGLEKRYKYFTLKIQKLTFNRGINLVLGPNGSGKSTLLKLIAGFVRPNRGGVYVVTDDGQKIPSWRLVRWIGYVGEDIMLPNVKVKSILEDFLGGAKAEEMALTLGLEGYLHKKYLELSAGYRKRVQLAIALGKDAKIILLDEPFANLDMLMVEPLREILLRLSDRIVIVTSHQPFNIKPSTLTLLDQGRLIYHGEYSGSQLDIVVEIMGEEHTLSLDTFNTIISPLRVKNVVTMYEKLLKMLLSKGRRVSSTV